MYSIERRLAIDPRSGDERQEIVADAYNFLTSEVTMVQSVVRSLLIIERQVRQKNPLCSGANVPEIQIYYQQKELSKAIDVFENIVRMAPEKAEAKQLLQLCRSESP